ncbi:dihydrofolate reductase [uncultured Phocaeicola sp.]|uniref:dihydrofolate reductase n=1 Tax=uncultured Phocaeicola sp. TaxID=990718 RepID=UPI0025EDBD39|nr:dihydrofolate reductase [uncultured Phocaeicola sp.]
MILSIIVAVNKDLAIGFENRLIYRVPNDLKRFKALTTGHTIVMGRKTFESLPKGALPNRRNIVLSRQDLRLPRAECFHSLDEALEACRTDEEVFVIGGASLYREALPLAHRLYLTEVDDAGKPADTFFPAIDAGTWNEKSRECHPSDEKHLYPYCFIDYERKSGR